MAGIDRIKWSEKPVSVMQIISYLKLPKIFKVIKGHYGSEDSETLGNLQIIRIHRKHSQTRVVAIDERNRYFSLPLEYDVPFDVLPINPETISMLLSDVVKKYSFPRKIQFSQHYEICASYIDNNVKLDSNFGTLTLLKLYDEHYLQANSIIDDILDDNIIIIPAYMNMECIIAENSLSGDLEEFETLQKNFLTQIEKKNIDFDSVTGNKDISLYFPRNVERNNHDYVNLEPNKIIRIQSIKLSDAKMMSKSGAATAIGNNFLLEIPDSAASHVPKYTRLMPGEQVKLLNREPILDVKQADAQLEIKPSDNRVKMEEKKSKESGKLQKSCHKAIGKSLRKMGDVPHDLSILSVSQVGNLLQLLNMENYVMKFKMQQVDGSKLISLSSVLLINDYGMSKYEAQNLIKFIMERHKETEGKRKIFGLFKR